LIDVTHTLSAFIQAFPPAAALLLQGKGLLLIEAVPVYGELIPELHRALAAAPDQAEQAVAEVNISL
jgi:hypothetical protein